MNLSNVKINNIEFDVNKEKNQIILLNSFKKSDDFISQLKNRFNGKNKKIPHFLINKDGKILKFISTDTISEFFLNNGNNAIIICFENFGWMEKVPTKNFYSNFLGYIKKNDIYEKKWRDYFFWDIYSIEQINSAIELCQKLMIDYPMIKKFIGHNTKINDAEHFNGIVSKSNYNTFYTDLNPSFPFLKFTNLLNNEK